ncbi:hypothetical protein HOLDEFILI_03572 [Holdemania filiformis DSM 12042]|uniref:Uncharacterized protein n=1 Tax=Holdemania filiformis DSM 12042 TaxID=545696 RepID=B9YCL1_9FIRM|nr:hypothetical protein HOLDEFILI_03572 [Holdemania filiformis DSM 12042]
MTYPVFLRKSGVKSALSAVRKNGKQIGVPVEFLDEFPLGTRYNESRVKNQINPVLIP